MKPPYVFPVTDERIEGKGITLRDYFAGQAMIALINKDTTPQLENIEDEYVSIRAYELADAMLRTWSISQ